VIHIASSDLDAARKAISIIESIVEEVQVGKVYTGKVKKIMDFGAFVEVTPGNDGLLHISEIAHERIQRVTDVLKEGDEVSAVIVNIDRKSRNIQLSIKAKDAADQQEAMANLNQNTGNVGTTSLGALLRAKLDNTDSK